jgi:DNA helicase-2/ATP-dependent DNA helicase PcrA
VQPFKDVQGYGKVLHEIMMHIHRAWLDGERPDEAAVDRIAEDALYLPQSPLHGFL